MLKGLRTVAITVPDLDAAKRWYADVLGFGPYFDENFYVGFDVGGYELGLHPTTEPGGSPTTYWEVDDIEAATQRLVQSGAVPVDAIQDVGQDILVTSLRDPFGNVLGLIRNPHFAPPLVATGGDELADRAVCLDVLVPAAPHVVWPLWTSSEGFAQWWTPNSRIDLRIGGFFEFYFMPDNPWGTRGAEGCRVLSFVPQRMLSFTWNAPPNLKTRSQHTWCVVEFEPEGDGTRVRLTHLGWPETGWTDPDSDWPATFEYFQSAWRNVLDLFAEQFAT